MSFDLSSYKHQSSSNFALKHSLHEKRKNAELFPIYYDSEDDKGWKKKNKILVAKEVVVGQLDYFKAEEEFWPAVDRKVILQCVWQKVVSAKDTHPLPSSQHVRCNP